MTKGCPTVTGVKEERHIVVYSKVKKHKRERGRKEDDLRENGDHVTEDKKQTEGADCAVFKLHSTSDFPYK